MAPWIELDPRRQRGFIAVTRSVRPNTLGALAPCSGFLTRGWSRVPTAIHDAWRVARLNRARQAAGGKFGENFPSLRKRLWSSKK
jgi:hypothetical protein